MDLIGTLAGALGVESKAAEAVAGAVMANVKGQVADGTEGDAVEASLDAAVPELEGWMATAQEVASENDDQAELGGLGGLLGMANSGMGQQLLGAVAGPSAQNAALLAGVLGTLGLDSTKATMAAPFVLQFLQSRMDKGTLDQVLSVAPMLTGKTPEGGATGGVMGALGGLFGS